MIFKIIQLRRQVKDGMAFFDDPAKTANSAVKGTIQGMIWAYIINFIVITVLIYGGLFILGFTDLLGGPYGFMKVLFVLLAIPLCLTIVAGISFYKNIKRGITKRNNQSKVDTKVIDVKVE